MVLPINYHCLYDQSLQNYLILITNKTGVYHRVSRNRKSSLHNNYSLIKLVYYYNHYNNEYSIYYSNLRPFLLVEGCLCQLIVMIGLL